MSDILSDSRWTGVSGISALIMLLLYIVVERDKLADPAKLLVSGLLKYSLALIPAIVFFSVGAIYNKTKGGFGYLPEPLLIISIIIAQSLPALPVIVIITAMQPYPRLKAALIGSAVGACGGALLMLIVGFTAKPEWNTVLTAIGVEAVVGYYIGMTTFFVNQIFKKVPSTIKGGKT